MAQNRPYNNQVRNSANVTLDQQLGVAANGTFVLTVPTGNINFNNTSTVTVSITANGNNQTNVALTAAGASVNANGSLTGPSWFHVNGWYHQWGEASPGGGSPQMITFPTAFPNACQSVVCIPYALNETIWVLNVSSTSFNVSVGASGQAFMWQADGY